MTVTVTEQNNQVIVSTTGSQGPAGGVGPAGTSVLNGSSAPQSSDGNNGDFFLETTNSRLYGPKAGGAWPGSYVSLIGPTGSTGSTGSAGSDGSDGQDGKTLLNGSGTPSGGNNGDFWIDTTNNRIYGPKASGSWPSGFTSLVGPQGQVGQTGSVGPSGAAASITVGSVSTGAAGSSATVSNSGSSSAATFDFSIPKGDKGDTGDVGSSGPQGQVGATGSAATIAVGSTSTGNPGTNASVTNSGSSSAATFDFTIPRGATGESGSDGKTVLNGSGAPGSGLGVDGDFYIDTTNNAIYGPKASGAWGSGTSYLQGPAGQDGQDGQGITDGDKGDVVVSNTGTVWTIDNNAITNAKILDDTIAESKLDIHGGGPSGTNKFLGYTANGMEWAVPPDTDTQYSVGDNGLTKNNFTDALKTKLDSVESNSTADQTDAEIRAAVEAASDSNVFTDADHNKLNAIEANATADMTGSEIKSAYEGESNTNAYTDAEKTKLSGIATSANNYAISSDLLDEDNMSTNSATKVPSQQSVKAYVDANSSDTTYTAGTGLNLSGTTFSVTSLALTTVQTASSESSQLSLTTQEGDIVVRTDENKSYVRNSGSAGSMADFTLLRTPTDSVLSVNGNTGAITAAQIASAVEAASDSNTFTDNDHTKLNGIAASANNYSISSDLLDEDNMASDSSTKVASQQSIKAYVDANTGTTDLSYTASSRELASSTGTNVTLPEVTTSNAGLLSASDKSKLDGIATGATNVTNNNQLTNGANYVTSSIISSLDAGNLSSGKVPIDRLGSSGTASSSTFLRGDNSWQTISTATPAGSNGEIQYYYNGALASQSGFTIDNSTGDVYIAGASGGFQWDKSASELNLGSGAKAKFGGGSNYAYIHYSPSATRPELYINNSNPFTLTASGGDIAEIHQTGEVILKGDFFLKDGTTTKIQWDKSDDALEFAGQTKLKLGYSSEIYSDGSGYLKLDTANNTEFDISGTQRLKVNSQGATITGTCTATVGFSGSAANLTNVNAESVDVTLSSTNANHFPLFASSNGSGQAGNTANAQDVLADGNLFYNPSTNVLTAGSFSGSGANLTNLPAPTPAGSDKQIQFNNSNSLGANANLTFNTSTSSLGTPIVTLSDSLKTSARVKVNTGATAQYETIDFDTNGETNFKYQSSTRLQLKSSGVAFYGTTFDINGAVDISGQCVANSFSGTGSSLTNLTAANISSGGTLPALDGSNLTNLPASGGTVDLYTSSGSGVTAGQPVYVNTSGQAVAVSGSSVDKQPINKYVNEAGNWFFHNPPSSTSGGAPGSGVSGNNISDGYSQAICTISGVTYIVITYRDQSNSSHGYYRVGSFDTSNVRTLTWGTATAFNNLTNAYCPHIVNMGDTGRFVIAAHASGSWNTIRFWAVTINTSSLSLTINSSSNGEPLLSNHGSYYSSQYGTAIQLAQKNDSFCFCSLRDQGGYARITQIQWSGSTSYFTAVDPSYMLGTSWYYGGNYGQSIALAFSNVGNSSGILAMSGHGGSSGSNSGNVTVVTAVAPPDNQSWTSVNYQSNSSLGDPPRGDSQMINWLGTHKFAVSYVKRAVDWEQASDAYIVLVNVDSTNNYSINSIGANQITTGSERIQNKTLFVAFEVANSRFVISYTLEQDSSGNTTWYPYTNTATLSGSTGITLGTASKLAMPTGDGSGIFTNKTTYGEDSFFQILVPCNSDAISHPADSTCYIQASGVGGGQSTNDRGWMQFLETKNLSHDGASFIGFAQSSISAGAEGTINVTGSVNDQVSGLTSGSIYYIGAGGNLSTTAVSPTTRVGIALSSTKILVGA